MDQLIDLADTRLFRGCAYCGAEPSSRDHVPSKVFLDEPFPTELPVVGACKQCNNGFSQDEEYLACLIECALIGTVDPRLHRRDKIAKILQRSSGLRTRLAAAHSEMDGQISFVVEEARVRNVVLKLAKGHVMFELSWFLDNEPTSIRWLPLALLSKDQLEAFEAPAPVEMFGEIGTRSMQRVCVLEFAIVGPGGEEHVCQRLVCDWINVQHERYRYLVTDHHGVVRVKMVLGEYLACEVVWNEA